MNTSADRLQQHQVEIEAFYRTQVDGFWYDKYPAYLSLYRDRLDKRNNAILQALPTPLGYVLDIGCGRGDVMARLAPRANKVVGTDLAEVMVRRTRENLRQLSNVDVRCAPAEKLPFDDNSFDAVVLADVIEHLLDPGACLMECARVLRPGGCIVITTPNPAIERFWTLADHVLTVPIRLARRLANGTEAKAGAETYERFLSPGELEQLGTQNGFFVREHRNIEFYPGSEGGGAFRYFLRVAARWAPVRRLLVEPIFGALFTSIEWFRVLNNRQLLVLALKDSSRGSR